MPEVSTQTDVSFSKHARYNKDPEYRQIQIQQAQEANKKKLEEEPDEMKSKWRDQYRKRMQSEEYRQQRIAYMREYRKKKQEEVKQLKQIAETGSSVPN